MARNESDREDLLRQATALVERAEFALPQRSEPVVVGFRKDGSASFYFGVEPVYQFNAAGQLRRAYLGGLLYKASCGLLSKMRRERSGGEVALITTSLSEAETACVLAEMRQHLEELNAALVSRTATLIGQVPADGQVLSRVSKWLAARPAVISIASRPNAQ